MDPISTGTVIGGRYRVAALIGEGAMGTVYRVERPETDEVFALKLLNSELGRHPTIIARFEREAIAASRIRHPNVVRAVDFGCSHDGSFFLALELVEGRDLRAELRDGPMEASRAVNIMRGVVAGIRAAHETGVIHRDLKPENIMLVEREGNRDFVKLLDFGIARLESAGNPQSGMVPLTVAGSPLGTPEYMSPEQVLGRAVDARSDLYSLGVIFFELLAGTSPFDGSIAKLLQQHLSAEPPELPPDVVAEHPDLARIVRMLLAKEPKNRFQSAGELAEALNASVAGRAGQGARAAVSAPEGESRTLASLAMRASLARKRLVGIVAPPARSRRSSRRRGWIAALLGAMALAVLVFVMARDRSAPATPEPPGPNATSRAEPPRTDPTRTDPARASAARTETPARPPSTVDGAKGSATKPHAKPSDDKTTKGKVK